MDRRWFLQAMGTGALASVGIPGWLQALAAAPRGAVPEAYHPFALGGLGAGSIMVHSDGLFRRWTMLGNAPWGAGTPLPHPIFNDKAIEEAGFFFTVRYQEQGKPVQVKMLATRNPFDAIPTVPGSSTKPVAVGVMGSVSMKHHFPYVTITYKAPDMPFEIVAEAYSPFVPHDLAASTLPGVYFTFHLRSTGSKPVSIMLSATVLNRAGYDVAARKPYVMLHEREDFQYFSMAASEVPQGHAAWGQLALGARGGTTSYYTGWHQPLDFLATLAAGEKLPNQNLASPEAIDTAVPPPNQPQAGTIACTTTLQQGGTATLHMILAWCFPNVQVPVAGAAANAGRYYQNAFSNAREVMTHMLLRQVELRKKMDTFWEVYVHSAIPKEVLEAIVAPMAGLVAHSIVGKEGVLYLVNETNGTDDRYNAAGLQLMVSQALMQFLPDLQLKTMDAQKKMWDALLANGGTLARKAGAPSIEAACAYVLPMLRQYFLTNDFESLKHHWSTLLPVSDYIAQYYPVPALGRPYPATYGLHQLHGASGYLHPLCLMVMEGMVQCGDVLNDWNVQKKYRKYRDELAAQLQEQLWTGSYYRLWAALPGAPQRKGTDEGCHALQVMGSATAVQSQTKGLLPETQTQAALQAIWKANYGAGKGMQATTWPQGAKPVVVPTGEGTAEDLNNHIELSIAPAFMYYGMHKEALQLAMEPVRRWLGKGYPTGQTAALSQLAGAALMNAALGLKIFRDKIEFEPIPSLLPSGKVFFMLPTGYGHFTLTPGKVSIIMWQGNIRMRQLVIRMPTAPYKKVGMRLNGEQLRGDLLRMQSDFAEARWKDMMIFKTGNEFEMLLS